MKQNYPHFPISSRFSEFSAQPAAFLSTTTSAKHLFDFSFCFYKSSAEVLLWMKHAIRNLENHLPVAPSWMDWLAPPWLCTWRQQGLYVPIYSCPLSLTKTLPFSFTLNPGLTFHLRSAVFRRTTPQWTDRVAKLHRTTITTTMMMMMMMRTTAQPGDVCFVRIPVGQAYSEQPGPEHEPAHRSDVAKGCRSSALRPHRPPSSL